MTNLFEYWEGRKGLQMWVVLEDGTVEVDFPFNTAQAERLQSRPDFVGVIHHLKRNEGDYNVTVSHGGKEHTAECNTFEEAVVQCKRLTLRVAS